jgi:uncharacterized protein YprB with RNaseH-like and TPR domain
LGEQDRELRDRLQSLRKTARKTRREETRSPGLEGIGAVASGAGLLRVERTLAGLAGAEAEAALLRRTAAAARSARARGDVDPEIRALLEEPGAVLFVDTETTGLGGNMVFLLGAMRIVGAEVVLTQVFARDYRGEPALLRAWTEMLGTAGMLVTFNGKSFDLPVLRDRLGLHGIQAVPEPPHVDLLHHARRRWRDVLPDCRLQTLEWRVCGRRRAGDIPGSEIPEVYHRYVRTGEPADILSVFHHNALDLVTLAELAVALAGPEDEPA